MKKTLSLFLVLALLLFCGMPKVQATAETLPYASKYFSSYSVSLDNEGNTLKATFAVFGTKTLDKLGAKSIYFQRSSNGSSWTTVKSISYSSQPDILGHSATLHASTSSYTATPGYYYRAYIVLWAENNGDSEYRHLYTNSVYL